jgi:hypothetical protein|tara:strand:- start:709 stop:906 length:198 start_codon:yes stop_codon:yes gene_type:complete
MNNLYAKVIGKRMKIATSSKSVSRINEIMKTGSVVFDKSMNLMPKAFIIPLADGSIVDINSTNLK